MAKSTEYPKTITMSTNPHKLGTTNSPMPSRGREMPQDIEVRFRDKGASADQRPRPAADHDYQENLKKFERHDLSSREPNRDKAGEPTRKR